MIHELLLALSGYPGSIFTWNKRSGLQVRRASQAGTLFEPLQRGGTREKPTDCTQELRKNPGPTGLSSAYVCGETRPCWETARDLYFLLPINLLLSLSVGARL